MCTCFLFETHDHTLHDISMKKEGPAAVPRGQPGRGTFGTVSLRGTGVRQYRLEKRIKGPRLRAQQPRKSAHVLRSSALKKRQETSRNCRLG